MTGEDLESDAGGSAWGVACRKSQRREVCREFVRVCVWLFSPRVRLNCAGSRLLRQGQQLVCLSALLPWLGDASESKELATRTPGQRRAPRKMPKIDALLEASNLSMRCELSLCRFAFLAVLSSSTCLAG